MKGVFIIFKKNKKYMSPLSRPKLLEKPTEKIPTGAKCMA